MNTCPKKGTEKGKQRDFRAPSRWHVACSLVRAERQGWKQSPTHVVLRGGLCRLLWSGGGEEGVGAASKVAQLSLACSGCGCRALPLVEHTRPHVQKQDRLTNACSESGLSVRAYASALLMLGSHSPGRQWT